MYNGIASATSSVEVPYTFVSLELVSLLCLSLCDPMGPSRLLCPLNSLGKNTGVGCHSLFQGIFLTQVLNLGLPYCRQILYHLSCQDDQILLSLS